jgi:hypothetical protein
MCCFSVTRPLGLFAGLFAPRIHVSATSIFARMIEPGRQALAYGMNLDSAAEVAMVLPLPVVPGSGDDAARFISLEKHPRMFGELAELFVPMAAQRKGGLIPSFAPRRQKLAVHAVGSFVASYVPSRADFGRLDPRFRLPDLVFDAVPAYADHGFAVFQLAKGKHTIHPMALSFPTRAPAKLFFPTVHLHDGTWHRTAKFDHALYYQHAAAGDDVVALLSPDKTYEGLLDDKPLVRRRLRKRLPNADTWIAAA